jgi:predicted unusual protein kinase regulating ubiquinone biosynthesis (AarF/ABC1/UbiB family)
MGGETRGVRRRPVLAGLAALAAMGWVGVRLRGSARTARNLEIARLGSSLSTRYTAHRARRVFASAARREELDSAYELRTAEEVARALGNMKGFLMKLGQMASYVDESVPEPIRRALADLQQDAPPMAADLAASVVEQELGAPPDKVFLEWDAVPIAAASIGQVHRAITRDEVAVAVKVQYPGVDKAIQADLDNSDMFISLGSVMFPGSDTASLVQELRDRIGEELDYRQEALNQRMFADYYEGHPFIHIPAVVDPLSTGRVLTTELAVGARFSELDSWSQEERNLAAEAIDRFVFRSLYRMHAFNGDPHPGNYLFHGGGEVTFLDFGLVKRYTPAEITMLESMAKALVVDKDVPAYRRLLEEAGVLKPGADMSDERVVQYFGYFYEMVMEDREYTMTIEYASQAAARFMPFGEGSFPEIRQFGNLPPAFVVLQRINLGLTAVLGHLGATANWRRIAEELWPFADAPPSTEMGEKEAVWRRERSR